MPIPLDLLEYARAPSINLERAFLQDSAALIQTEIRPTFIRWMFRVYGTLAIAGNFKTNFFLHVFRCIMGPVYLYVSAGHLIMSEDEFLECYRPCHFIFHGG